MDDNDTNNYLEYWMENDPFFSQTLGNNNNIVEDVEHYSDRGIPRTAVSLNENLVLLFPPYQTGFDYSQIDYSRNK